MAYPFRRMTKRQLRKLLRDDRKRNLHLSESPDCPQTDSPIYQCVSIQKQPFRSRHDFNRFPLIATRKQFHLKRKPLS